MFDPAKFVTPSAKPLPVVLLLDVSSSMSGDKIESLNKAVKDMLDTFAQEEKMETEILVAVITFGEEVRLHLPYTKASQVYWQGLSASGTTPMGKALSMAKTMIEDKKITLSRAYRPTVVLVSDGQPNDSWEMPLQDFIFSGRSSKCDRMAMAIGRDADETVLRKFISNTPHKLFYAQNADQLYEFFQRVTMSVTMRSKSQNPNLVPTATEVRLQTSSFDPSNFKTTTARADDEGYW